MAYRVNARDEALRGRFWYGPFRPTGQGAGGLAAFIVIAPLAVGVATLRETIHCDRSVGVCRFERRELIGTVRRSTFPIADVIEVRWVPGSGKQKNQAESVLVMRAGADLRLASEGKDEAQARQTRLKQFFGGAGEPRLSEHWTTGPGSKLVLIGLAMLAGVLAFTGLSKSVPLRVEVFGDRVLVRRRRRTIEVSEAQKVRVDIDPGDTKLASVVVETPHGEERLLEEARSGMGAHQRAARELAKLLSVEVEVGPESPPWLRLPRKIPRSAFWIATATLAVSLVFIALSLVESRVHGTLELECRGRCRFGAMECLPGGSVSMGLSPGNYVVETWAPNQPDHWKKHSVPIKIGVTQHFVCPAEATRSP